MNALDSIVLGLTQGATEFIPVSSSGHLEVVQRILGGGAREANFHIFLELINFGTLLALLIYYRKPIMKIFNDIFRKHNWRMAINLLLTSIPAGVIGLLLGGLIEDMPFFSSLVTIAVAMGVVGLLMVFVDRLPHKSALKDEEDLTPGRALTIGLAQTFALIPGVSRSGSTIVTGRLMGLDSHAAADYSFLASIPIMLGVCAKTVLSSTSRAYIAENMGMVLLSNFVAFVSGLTALYFVMKFLKKHNSLVAFGIYRVVLACVILALVLFGVFPA